MPVITPELVFRLARDSMHQEIEGLHSPADALDDFFWQVAQMRCDSAGMVWVTAVGTSAAVAFVHDTGSSLARTCQYVLPFCSPQEHELKSLVATSSTVVFSAMCDALCTMVAEARGCSSAKIAKIHLSGVVGRALNQT